MPAAGNASALKWLAVLKLFETVRYPIKKYGDCGSNYTTGANKNRQQINGRMRQILTAVKPPTSRSALQTDGTLL